MSPDLKIIDRYRGALLGLAIGDALGAAVEFKLPGTFEPLTGYRGGGPHPIQPGQWTDDTALALITAQELIEAHGAWKPKRILHGFYEYMTLGRESPTGWCFDIGMATRAALNRFAATGLPYPGAGSLTAGGNGSLMRLAPVVLAYYAHPQFATYVTRSAKLTHGHPEAIAATEALARRIARAIDGHDKARVLDPSQDPSGQPPATLRATRDYATPRAGPNAFAPITLHAALWAFATTDDFRSCVLAAANLGFDADTVAAVAGQLAGAYYGASGIPLDLVDGLFQSGRIAATGDDLFLIALSHLDQENQ